MEYFSKKNEKNKNKTIKEQNVIFFRRVDFNFVSC